MKWTIIQVMLLYAFVGCKEDTGAQLNTKVVNFGEEFQLQVNQKAVVTGNGSGEVTDSLLVEMITIKDTRCGDCISGGAAEIALKASTRKQSEDLTMCIGPDCNHPNRHIDGRNDTLSFTLDNVSYSLIFKDAVPFPDVNGGRKDNGAERAILEVIR